VASFVSGCLITNPVEFEQEEPQPPFILDVSRSDNPIGSILEINLDLNPSRIQIPVRIRDENLFQDLTARSRLVTVPIPEPEYGEGVLIPEQGELMRDEVFVEAGDIKRGECHLLELVVSGSFVPGDDPELFDVVSEPDDIGRASWTIWEVSGDPLAETGAAAAQNLVKTCPTEDARTVTGVEDPAP
jgi:hypothetical protein